MDSNDIIDTIIYILAEITSFFAKVISFIISPFVKKKSKK